KYRRPAARRGTRAGHRHDTGSAALFRCFVPAKWAGPDLHPDDRVQHGGIEARHAQELTPPCHATKLERADETVSWALRLSAPGAARAKQARQGSALPRSPEPTSPSHSTISQREPALPRSSRAPAQR